MAVAIIESSGRAGLANAAFTYGGRDTRPYSRLGSDIVGKPLIGPGTLVFYKDLIKRFNARTSLDAVSTYTRTGRGRQRWGEDEAMERAGFGTLYSGFARVRNNFDDCEALEEHQIAPKDDYVPPPLVLTQFGSKHTRRRFPPDPRFAVFPINDEDRTDADGSAVLTDKTRQSIDEVTEKLYRKSRYHDEYKDTTEYLRRCNEREAQFKVEGPNYYPQHSCSRVLLHPDPCPYCHIPRHSLEPKPQRRLNPENEPPPTGCGHAQATENDNDDTTRPCNRCRQVDCVHKDHCHNYITTKLPELQTGAANIGELKGLCKHGLHTARCSFCITDIPNYGPPTLTSEYLTSPADSRSDKFGPLYEGTKQWPTGKPGLPRIPESQYKNAPDVNLRLNLGGEESQSQPMGCGDASTTPSPSRNAWSYRDSNNLRTPCITQVHGTLDKSQATARFYDRHRDRTPDSRYFHRYSTRVSFLGYNSAVFHG